MNVDKKFIKEDDWTLPKDLNKELPSLMKTNLIKKKKKRIIKE